MYQDFVYQVVIAEQTVQHCEDLLEAHTGDSKRELLKAFHANNVDISAYHNGSIDGNHCMYMGANGDKIMDAMTKGMEPKIRNANNKKYLHNICVDMNKILKLWYEITRTMKSVEYQDDEACSTFEKNILELNKAVNSLIKTPPVPGCKLKHSKQLKSHLLFDWEVHDFLKTWRTLGAVDEQNIEGVHPQFNQLVRRYGNTRGRRKQQMVMNEFLFSHSTWIEHTIDDLLRKTKRKKVRGGADESHDINVAPSVKAVKPGRRGDDEEEEDGLFPETATLSATERRINDDTDFHGFKKVDTRISACPVCKRRLLQFAAKIHVNEVHKKHAGEETNE